MLEKKELGVKKTPIECHTFLGIPQVLESGFVDIIGNDELLKSFKIGLICSIKCPGEVILKTLNLLHHMDKAKVCFISGFHSPVEQECFDLLLRSRQKMIICPARNIQRMRLSQEVKRGVIEEWIALISPFPEKYRTTSKKTAQLRNLMVAALANRVLVLHAAPGGKTEEIVKAVIRWGKTVYTIESKYNDHLAKFGVRLINTLENME